MQRSDGGREIAPSPRTARRKDLSDMNWPHYSCPLLFLLYKQVFVFCLDEVESAIWLRLNGLNPIIERLPQTTHLCWHVIKKKKKNLLYCSTLFLNISHNQLRSRYLYDSLWIIESYVDVNSFWITALESALKVEKSWMNFFIKAANISLHNLLGKQHFATECELAARA